jgi:CDP-paratose 2-epimerase
MTAHDGGDRREPGAPRTGGPCLGAVEWFCPGEHERVEQVIEALRRAGIERLRTGVSWADYHTRAGHPWYDWLLPRLARELELLPCFTYTPPSLGLVAKSSAPPREPKAYADFLDVMITAHGRHFEWVELWNEPNNLNDWDWRLTGPSSVARGSCLAACARAIPTGSK